MGRMENASHVSEQSHYLKVLARFRRIVAESLRHFSVHNFLAWGQGQYYHASFSSYAKLLVLRIKHCSLG